jgi:hypothetical protein
MELAQLLASHRQVAETHVLHKFTRIRLISSKLCQKLLLLAIGSDTGYTSLYAFIFINLAGRRQFGSVKRLNQRPERGVRR